MNKDYTITITVEICDCEDEQEAISFVEDNILASGLSQFNTDIEAICSGIGQEVSDETI